MNSSKSSGWPTAKEGPTTSNTYEGSSNPVLRGYTLAAITTLVKSSTIVQGVLWKLNKFDQLKNIPGIDGHEPRYDPTVVPSFDSDSESGNVIDVAGLKVPRSRLQNSDYYTIGDFYEAFTSKRLTPLDVVDTLLPLIVRGEKKQATGFALDFLDVRSDMVRAAAQASTERWKRGKPLSILDGVPVAVKAQVNLAGHSKTLGSKMDFARAGDTTSWCVQKWMDAGAIVLGTTNMYEAGLDPSGNNPNTGTPLMPHNKDYYPGGSSSGSGAAVAHGICPITLGADGGGSIRVPAAFNGVYGLKPSHGRVSGRPTEDLAYSVGVYGPVASDIDSLAIAYRIMAQPDPEGRNSRFFPHPLAKGSLDSSMSPRGGPTPDKVIGICSEWVARSDPEVLSLFNKAIDHYRTQQGYKIVDIKLPYLPENQKAHALTILCEIRAGFSDSQIHQLIYPSQLLLTVVGNHATAHDLLAAQKLRTIMMQHLAWLWKEYPGMLIVTPTTPFAGWKIKHQNDTSTRGFGISDGDMSLRCMEYVYLANWTGCPSLTRPMGYSADNAPVGLMAMNEWGGEEQLIEWARQGEMILEGGSIRRPGGDETAATETSIAGGNATQSSTWLDVLKKASTVGATSKTGDA